MTTTQKTYTVVLTDAEVKKIGDLMQTRPTQNFDQVLMHCVGAGIKNEHYRQQRNRRMYQMRKVQDAVLSQEELNAKAREVAVSMGYDPDELFN
jgi:hypothetical protein